MDEQKRIFTDGTIKVCATDRKKNYKVRLQMLNGLKNRNGYVPAHTLPFTYDAASSLFTEGV